MQVIDPSVTSKKYEDELKCFTQGEEYQRRRGIFLIKAEYPNIYLAFCAANLRPAVVVFAVRINFDNYDLEALSVRFVNPFTLELISDVPINMFRKLILDGGGVQMQILAQKDETGLPFICIPGIREYHEHPAHTGDSWLLHRAVAGEGTLGFLIDKLYEYGTSAINGFQIQVNIQAPAVVLTLDNNKIPL